MNVKENFLRAATITGPEWIPCSIGITQPLWQKYRERMEDLVLRHPAIFGEYHRGTKDFDDFGVRRKGNTITDEWGCVWSFLADGLQGQVVKHPLEDWKALDSYEPPDPILLNMSPVEGCPPNSYDKAKSNLEKAKRSGRLAVGGLPHGFMFQRLYYLRGFANLMKDFLQQPPGLNKLLNIVQDYNMKLTHRWLDAGGIDLFSCGDDVGMQDRLTIHPTLFRKYLIPAYSAMFIPVRETGAQVRLHSDGHLMEIADDLIKSGVSILNLQDLVNGIKHIQKRLKSNVCVDLDIDRQKVVPFGTPEAVKKHVRNAVSTLNSPEGGLMITVGIYPPTQIENIEALCQVLEEVGAGPKN